MGVAFALTSALAWGGGDFSGGFATRRSNQYHVLAISAVSGILVLAVCAVLWGESFPTPGGILLMMVAGVLDAVALAALYRALSLGDAATVAPTTGVIGALLPVLFSFFIHGFPGVLRAVGFVLALIGIWLVSQSASAASGTSRQSFLLACLAGVGFGGFFILLSRVDHSLVFTPLIIARLVCLLMAWLLLRVNGLPLGSFTGNRIAWLAGVLDAGGNLFYMLASRFTRLDIAVVLSSLYPAVTVVLAGVLLKERASRRQWLGAGVCLTAIVLITL